LILKKILLLGISILFVALTNAQHQELGEKPSIWKEKDKQAIDSNTLLYAFKNGSMNGHLRYFFMATDNQTGLSDYHAHAGGGGIKFETARFKGFQLGISGFFTFNMASSDLSKPDPTTNQGNRYEIGLFDVEDPNNKSDIDRLEELYVKYNVGNSFITVGKQLINTPFINLQDGRMRPTEASGIWTEINSIKKTKIEGGLINQISPRGTVKWYSVSESIGVYSSGLNIDGSKSGYAENTNTKGIAMVGITHKTSRSLTLKFWNLFVENIFNTSMLQADLKQPLSSNGDVIAGLQFIQQNKIGNGGNKELSKRYFQDNSATTFGANFGWENKSWKTSFNYNRITAAGRYLMPREWGRDPFYTFMSRERNEGLADVNAFVIKVGYHIPKTTIKTTAALGYFDLPKITDVAKNKYSMPSYSQLNIDIRYEFTGLLNGLGAQLLYVYKNKVGNTPIIDKYIINKVNMSLWNLVLNYNF
jgi:hypothetical protein